MCSVEKSGKFKSKVYTYGYTIVKMLWSINDGSSPMMWTWEWVSIKFEMSYACIACTSRYLNSTIHIATEIILISSGTNIILGLNSVHHRAHDFELGETSFWHLHHSSNRSEFQFRRDFNEIPCNDKHKLNIFNYIVYDFILWIVPIYDMFKFILNCAHVIGKSIWNVPAWMIVYEVLLCVHPSSFGSYTTFDQQLN